MLPTGSAIDLEHERESAHSDRKRAGIKHAWRLRGNRMARCGQSRWYGRSRQRRADACADPRIAGGRWLADDGWLSP
jgi:hypothetical protein